MTNRVWISKEEALERWPAPEKPNAWQALLAEQKAVNDAHDKVIDLPSSEYHRLNFVKLD